MTTPLSKRLYLTSTNSVQPTGSVAAFAAPYPVLQFVRTPTTVEIHVPEIHFTTDVPLAFYLYLVGVVPPAMRPAQEHRFAVNGTYNAITDTSHIIVLANGTIGIFNSVVTPSVCVVSACVLVMHMPTLEIDA